MLEIKDALARTFVNASELILQVQRFLEPLIKAPVIALPQTNEGVQWWQEKAKQMRQTLLEQVVLCGVPQKWQQNPLKVDWLDTLPGNGYRIRKLRYQVIPDLWIPALLYEPTTVKPSTPAVLYLMGHEGRGKSVAYAQTFCINMAKRGIYALNPEWFGFGQLAHPELVHGCMNQLDLCGVRGVSVFYLSLKCALDVLLSLPNVDPKRIGVTGLSGGGWQTIFISALDERVTLANPVAGYSSFLTRLHHFKDLGDSEQTPCDMACFADYTDLTMLIAPRPLLLTFCAYDECCFEAGYALPPLLRVAQRVYRMLNAEDALSWHVNYDPGTHNYERDNREAFYRFIHRHWFRNDPQFETMEIPCDDELRSDEDLTVPLPPDNATINKLARTLSRFLPNIALPQGEKVSEQRRQQLAEQIFKVIVPESYRVWAIPFGSERHGDWQVTFWQLCVGNESGQFSLPATEIMGSEKPVGTTLLIADDGRKNAAELVQTLLAQKQRVFAVDLLFFGEAQLEQQNWQTWLALLIHASGKRLLGIQASQLAAIADWLVQERKSKPLTVCAVGPRSCLIALIATLLNPDGIDKLQLHGCLDSLSTIIEQNWTVDKAPELFCFGLLQVTDIPYLLTLLEPKPIIRH